ncbi:hypothetical protein VTK26DRAFT_8617 [Humicola hyalothermophila]
MTNPYQPQHGSSSFPGGDSVSSAGLPPLNVRRPSYASVVSGAPSALTRPARSSGFSHLLNPDPDSEQQQHAANYYSSAQNPRLDAAMTHSRNGASDDDVAAADNSALWPQRFGSGFAHFSRAFDLYMGKDPLLSSSPSGSEDFRFASGNPVPNISSTGFLSPSYLRGTVFLQKLEERHRAQVRAEREDRTSKNQPGAPIPSSARLATSNGTSHLPVFGSAAKLIAGDGTTHRGVAYDIVEKAGGPVGGDGGDDDDDTVSPLPSRWNRDDKDGALEVLGDGYEVKHSGRASDSHEASAIRADHFMPSSCGVYYFEITVLNKKKDKTPIGIGFASKDTSLARAPGWEPDSWAYHGDDGHCFAGHSSGKPYEKPFGAGDVVGCLVNFRLGHALFTRNGQELPIAFRDIHFKDVKGKLYPVVGLKTKDDHILANFGQMPFQFDIDGYMKKQQEMIQDEIRMADTSRLVPGLSETELIQQLVLQFLQHDGYVETARAFAEELQAEKSALRLHPNEPVAGINLKDDEDANNRQRIRHAILEGDMDRAIRQTDAYYPNVLRDNRLVYFHLRCRKFIEMIRKEAELNMVLEQKRKNGGSSKSLGRPARHQPQATDDGDEEMLEAGDAAAAADDDDMDMTAADDEAELNRLSQEALTYGIELRAEFKADPRPETSKKLDEIFSLIAYPNPLKVKEVSHLLDGSGRVAVAEELNSTILKSLGKSSRAALENVYAQTSVLLDDLRVDGGDGAFVTIRSVIEDIPPSSLR